MTKVGALNTGGDSEGDATLARLEELQIESLFSPVLKMGMDEERSEVLMHTSWLSSVSPARRPPVEVFDVRAREFVARPARTPPAVHRGVPERPHRRRRRSWR